MEFALIVITTEVLLFLVWYTKNTKPKVILNESNNITDRLKEIEDKISSLMIGNSMRGRREQ